MIVNKADTPNWEACQATPALRSSFRKAFETSYASSVSPIVLEGKYLPSTFAVALTSA